MGWGFPVRAVYRKDQADRCADRQQTKWFRHGATVFASVGCAFALSFGFAAAANAAIADGGGSSVTAISPSVQAGLASQEVDITGSGFTGATQVTFGGVPAYGVQVLSDSEIAAVAPQHANGPVDLVINTPHGNGPCPTVTPTPIPPTRTSMRA